MASAGSALAQTSRDIAEDQSAAELGELVGRRAADAVMIGLYLIPSIIAQCRRHPKKVRIMLLNILLGWTIIGWLAALVWACTPKPKPSDPSVLF